MNKISIIFFISLFFGSCTSNTILEKPENLIPRDQMVDLITDLIIAKEAKGIKNENLERKINYATILFEKYQIDSLRFKKSNLYYTSKIDDYNDILSKVDKRLKQYLVQIEKEIRENDSIERANRASEGKELNKAPKIEEFEGRVD